MVDQGQAIKKFEKTRERLKKTGYRKGQWLSTFIWVKAWFEIRKNELGSLFRNWYTLSSKEIFAGRNIFLYLTPENVDSRKLIPAKLFELVILEN